ncbi:MAG: hypothetical protein O2826_10630, partial [Chloroflexi bacterium]|nr:hypothetical protein [Chloroflexota bacterium]
TSCPTGAGNPLIPTVQFSGATSGFIYVDYSGTCAPSMILSPFPVPLGIVVNDAGGWSAIEGTEGGSYNAINENGGSLIAGASGCIGSDEFASVQIASSLGQSK